jgi:hypothetical protein
VTKEDFKLNDKLAQLLLKSGLSPLIHVQQWLMATPNPATEYQDVQDVLVGVV